MTDQLSAVDQAQTEAQIVGLQATRDQMLALNPPLDTSEVDVQIANLQSILNPPPPAPQEPPDDLLAEPYHYEKIDGKETGIRWRKFYYAGEWCVAPTPDHPSWPHFVAAYGPDIADDPTIRHPVPLDTNHD